MSRTTRPVMQIDSQRSLLPSSGDWTTKRFAYVAGTSNIEYAAFAKPGSAEGSLVWQIFKLAYDIADNLISVKYPISPTTGAVSNDFEFSWTAHAGYSYI
jgi:hypothetical protein